MTPVTFLQPYCYWKLFQSEVIYNMSKIRHSEENGLLNFGPKYGPDLNAVSKNS